MERFMWGDPQGVQHSPIYTAETIANFYREERGQPRMIRTGAGNTIRLMVASMPDLASEPIVCMKDGGENVVTSQ